jgi:hypothetical protein
MGPQTVQHLPKDPSDYGEGVMVASISRPKLSSAPREPEDVPEAHKGVLALVRAHDGVYKEPLAWPLLRLYVEHAAVEDLSDLPLGEELGRAGLPLILSRVVGDLVDFHLLKPTDSGLAFSAEGEAIYAAVLSQDGTRDSAAKAVVQRVNGELDDDTHSESVAAQP